MGVGAWNQYLALSEPDRSAVDVFAVADSHPTERDALLAIRAVTAADGARPESDMRLRARVTRLIGVGVLAGRRHVHPELGERIRRRLIDSGRFQEIARVLARLTPLPDTSWGWYRVPEAAVTRAYRQAFLTADMATMNEIARAWSRAYRRQLPNIVSWVVQPLDTATIERLPPPLAASVCDHIGREELLAERAEPGFVELLTRLSARSRVAFSRTLARRALLAGDIERVDPTTLGDTPQDLMVLGWYWLIRGDPKRSVKMYAAGLAEHRRSYGKDTHVLWGPEGLMLPMAFALRGGVGRLKQLGSILRLAEEQLQFATGPRSGVLAAYRQLHRLVTSEPVSVAATDPHPLVVLINALVGIWSDAQLPEGVLDAAIARARTMSWGWLAGELEAVRNGGSTPVRGAVALVSHRESSPAWVRRLDALEAALSSTASKTAAGPALRVAWELRYGEDWVDLRARAQKRKGRGGWAVGRVVAMSRLADNRSSVKGLGEQDLRIANCLSARRYSGWSDRSGTEYEWAPAATWKALAGHPAVFRHDDPGVPVVVVVKPPTLRVTKRRGSLLVSIEPLPGDAPFAVTEAGVARLEVVVFEKHHLQLLEILGDSLKLPAKAKERLGALTATLTDTFDVVDEAAATRAVDVAADTALVVQLRPDGGGLNARVLVRPFGDDGPSFEPGAGAALLLSRVEDQTRRVRRDLAGELKALDDLTVAAPTLSGVDLQSAGVSTTGLEESLALLQELQGAGDVRVEWPEGQPLRLHRQVGGKALSLSVKATGDWFAASGKLTVDEDLVIELADLVERVASSSGRFIVLEDGAFLALTSRLRRQLDALARIAERRASRIRLHTLASPVLDALVLDAGRTRTDKAWKERADLAEVSDLPPPTTLEAELRPYQRDGFAWLARLAAIGAGGCLADDMGLGKTVQTLALLLHRAKDGPALVVAPTSVAGTWRQEAWRFAPTLRLHRFGASGRQELLDELGPGDVLITSYGLLQSESERLAKLSWSTLVLDEAQAIKNHLTRRHKAAAALRARFRLALTGTPIENQLMELWSQFAVLNPGFLGKQKPFRERFVGPIEDGDRDVAGQLRRLILPFMLRRTKAAVLQDLPPRTEIVVPVELGAEEAALYESLRRRAVEELEGELDVQPLAVLAQLTRLRLACCNPRLIANPDRAAGAKLPPSAKLAAFSDIVDGLLASRHRALVFSQFVKHLALIREHLDARGITYQYLDGSTPAAQRQRRVDAFQAGEGDLFLISLRAGGTGLNLTGADYVVHMDPWWNPAVEDQASDRAHRIGQTRPVTVYRLVAAGTIEEQIVALHHRKRDLADRLLAGADAAAKLSTAAMLELIRDSAAESSR